MMHSTYIKPRLMSESENMDVWNAAKNGNVYLLEECFNDDNYFNKYLNRKYLFMNELYTPLQIAIAHHREEASSFLIEQGAKLDCTLETGDTLLHMTVKYKMLGIASELLQHRANVNTRNYLGETPLYRAVWDDNKEFVELFVEYRANPNARAKNHSTPLSFAMGRENVEALECMQRCFTEA